jgi:processive 1,2-diacylglycerol beta-glucosyltransferase
LLTNNGIAQYVTDTYPVDDAIYQLFNNSWKLSTLHDGIKQIGKPNATKDLCDFILGL